MRVSSTAAPRRSRIVAEETRELILQAAEVEFATHGFAAARLEDVAQRVEITRTAIIYHFGDKQTLYDAVLQAAFGALSERTTAALEANATPTERVERLIEAWLDVATERPTLARLFLREVASSDQHFRPEVQQLVEPMFRLVTDGVESGQRAGSVRKVDPNHFVAILAGATMWQATNAPLLENPSERDSQAEENQASFRAELLGVARYLLGDPGAKDST